MNTAFSAGIFLFDETLKLFDFRFALNDYFFSVSEDITDGRGDKLVENVKLHK